ncbi:unnamed protein product [Bemisia tabaci]|uniref:Uncharacterized protein n=1 Tax=Bemisia tabaci TaxID=7038 RepID=A0A9P0A8Q1_BEMTA|nr:unnamed protein product [Bemisia tabaci]
MPIILGLVEAGFFEQKLKLAKSSQVCSQIFVVCKSLNCLKSSGPYQRSEAWGARRAAEKDLGFLRIGSLNVRVKKTTEAFSNFLGKSQSSVEKIHKSWGSADNIQQNDNKTMPPPKFAPIKKRKSKKAQDFMSHSTPSTPDLRDVSSAESKFSDLKDTANAQDSDSDTACGFGSNWQP